MRIALATESGRAVLMSLVPAASENTAPMTDAPVISPRLTAALIDRLSRRIEDAVAAASVGESDEAAASRPQGADSAVNEAGLAV